MALTTLILRSGFVFGGSTGVRRPALLLLTFVSKPKSRLASPLPPDSFLQTFSCICVKMNS